MSSNESTDVTTPALRAADIHVRALQIFGHRARSAQERNAASVKRALDANLADAWSPLFPFELATSFVDYAVDCVQRAVLFWDTLRQRGSAFVEHELAGKPPLLHFDYDVVLDARTFERPANYSLARIEPPPGVTVDAARRPYVVIDPRAGHGPGVGAFEDDSQIGVALRAGHPVYFVLVHPVPEPHETLLDVCAAEQLFVGHVRALHPLSPKPVIIGGCQGGWAAMMLGASRPEEAGAIVVNGAPLSYWGGAWSEGEGNNPMRYVGALLGGTWLGSFAADLGNGLFDGANLVQNFENLDPANTYFGKYYRLFANIDREAPRFLEFERWWGGFYLMNRSEIEWITQNLFVGNELWTRNAKAGPQPFDLREIQCPIILFASLGDNITPPQQAFNWVADLYRSTEEIKARGQVIVGLLHRTTGHLGLFVSGKVAPREQAQLTSVLKSVEALPPGLYGMQIDERKRADGSIEYDVSFVERRLEEVVSHLHRVKRVDEAPFAAAAALSEFNQRAYEIFAQPLVRAVANDFTARLGRQLHPLRAQRWAFSDLNPWLSLLEVAADAIKSQRHSVAQDHPLRKWERAVAGFVSAGLDYLRDLRDAASELLFFQTFGALLPLSFAERGHGGERETHATDPRTLPFVKTALDAIEAGGYPAALARTAELLERKGAPVPLARLDRRAALTEEYAELLPELSVHDWKLVRAEQDLIVEFEPERALSTLPELLADPPDRERFLQVLDRIANDRELVEEPTPDQLEMVTRIRKALRAA
jgi:pimeloyl-ACP methyl ester carboxylesterase